MLDPRLLRENPDLIRESQRRRGESLHLVDELIDLDVRWRAAVSRFESLRAKQKEIGRAIGPLQGRLKKSPDPDLQAELDTALAQAQSLSEQVKAAEREAAEADAALQAGWLGISNIVDERSPVGGEDDFQVLAHAGTPRDFAAEGIALRDHLDLGTGLGAIDTERAAKVSGARFYYLTGPGALLEVALLNLALDTAGRNGFIPVIPPALVTSRAMEGTGFLGQAAENVYRLEADDMYLVGTAEVPLAAYHADEILAADSLPRRYVGFSPCFRREAGSYGKDTRGIIRVHQFDKVEMFSFTTPQDAADEHERLLTWEREFFDLLDVPYRVIDVATADLGASAARKFDIEAWIPTQGKYREVTSTSNCTDFQARRLNIRMREGAGSARPLATLNGTLVAMPRAIVAILENHQQADGSVTVPPALRGYLGGRATLEPVH